MDQDYEDDNDGVGFEMYDNGENCSNSNNREDSEETMVDDATVDACNWTQTEDKVPKQKSMPKPVIDPGLVLIHTNLRKQIWNLVPYKSESQMSYPGSTLIQAAPRIIIMPD